MNNEIKQRIEQIQNSEIPKGYKHSMVGIIPKDWEVLRLKDKFDRLSRKNAEGNTNVLTISAQYGLINQEEFFKKAVASDDKSNYYLLQRGEFAYNKSYSNGYPFGAIKRLSRYDKGVVSPLYICFSANADNACPEYYEQYFEAGKMNHEIQAFAQEGARNHGLLNISVSDFFNSFILVPPVAEQEKIAKILSTQDKVIECYEKKIEQLRLMKKYYLQNMFPKRGETIPKIRFKGFTDAWEQRKLGKITKRVFGNDGRMELPTLTISAANGWMNQVDRFSENKAGQEQNNYTLLRKGELSYNHGNSKIAKYGTVFSLESYEEALVPRVYHSFRMIDKHSPSFIEYCFATKNLDRELSKLITSGARMDGLLNISFDEFMGISLLLPCAEEQKRIANYLRAFDHFIAINQRKLEEEEQKKKSLAQLMLSGIVRV